MLRKREGDRGKDSDRESERESDRATEGGGKERVEDSEEREG